MPRKRIGLAVVVAVVALFGAACGDDSGSDLTVTDVWARTSPAMANAGAAYFLVTAGPEGDTLLSVAVSPSIAAAAELHEVVEVDMSSTTMGDSSSSTTDAMVGMMMREVESVAIPANGSLLFKPGAYHVMLMDLAAPLVAGETFDLTLTFERAGDVSVTAEVRDQ
ncbi:MAG: hypothetical protein A2Z12_01630 [Actinobacteria bacterium RBG_16_68_21]|nr:MAG: hypothetical protein A2Z12_01630 [Actinobacteria bacterium RBG_16_68_21]